MRESPRKKVLDSMSVREPEQAIALVPCGELLGVTEKKGAQIRNGVGGKIIL
jgi:hypothetical protein